MEKLKDVWEDFIDFIWYTPTHKVKVVWERFCRIWNYAKNVSQHDYDFDSHTIYLLLSDKLKRLKKVCMDEGHHEVQKQEIQSLRICIKLLDRIYDDHYYLNRMVDRHALKWGEASYTWKNKFEVNYPRANTPEEKKQASLEMYQYFQLSDKLNARDKKLMFDIMSKYISYWWD